MYVRTKDGREVDFVIAERDKPYLLIECKRNERSLAPNLKYFMNRMQVPLAFQLIETPGYLKQVDRASFIVGLDRFLQILP